MKIIDRIKGIILNPKKEWEIISQENTPSIVLLTNYLLPLALIPAIASFIGYGLIGYRVAFIGHVSGLAWGLKWAIMMFGNMLLGTYISAFIIDLLATNFGAEKNFDKSFSLVVYSYTPMMVAGILFLLPSLQVLPALAGLYGLYLLYIGIKPMMKSPDDKTTTYFIISLIVIIIVFGVLSSILRGLFIGRGLVNPAAF
jgi:uncharacterized membrane protein YwzB